VNLIAAVAETAPDLVDHLPDQDNILLSDVLDVLDEWAAVWEDVGRRHEQDLPRVRDLREGIHRLPEVPRAAVLASGLLRVPWDRWSSWVSDATGIVERDSWVQYVSGSFPDVRGLVAPQDNSPTLRVSAFQDRHVERRLLPLSLKLTAQPPYVGSVTLTAPAGCDMDDDGVCEHDATLCSAECSKVLIRDQGELALQCECHSLER
jgi:hypothetical protein